MNPQPNRLDVLRCADQDREVVAQLLNNAYADGRLTFDEHAERIAHAYDAKTFGDLNALTRDLVALPSELRQAPPAASAAPAASVSPASAQPQPQPVYGATPARVGHGGAVVGTTFTGGSALLSTFRPGAISAVSTLITLNAWLGEARVDLSQATFQSAETIVEVGGAMCEFKIRIPEGVAVDTSGLSTILGEVKVLGARPAVNGVVLRLRGTVMMGEVKLIGPDAPRNQFAKFKP